MSEALVTIYVIAFGPIGIAAGVAFLLWRRRREDRKLDTEMEQIRAEIRARKDQRPWVEGAPIKSLAALPTTASRR